MRVIYDIEQYTYDLSDFDDDFVPLIYVGFRKNNELPVEFTELSGEISVFKDSEKIYAYSFPENGVQYVSTDQDYVWLIDLVGVISPETEYVLEVTMINDDHQEFLIQPFVVGFPPKPGKSWVWENDDFVWVPPTPYPEDGNDYVWNDEEERWEKIESFKEDNS